MALPCKFFYNCNRPPGELLEICPRVYVLDCCSSVHILEGDDYKVYMESSGTWIRHNFPDASFMIFNFQGQRESQIAKILSRYNINVMDYPPNHNGWPVLKLEVVLHYLKSCENWLSLSKHNHLVLHCEKDGWLTLAFVLAALMIYLKHHTNVQRTLDMVYKQAPGKLLKMLSPLNPIPSQLRYLHYVSLSAAPEWPSLDRVVSLESIIFHMIPNFDEEGGCRPVFRIYGQDQFFSSNHTTKVLISTSEKNKFVQHYKQADCEQVKFDIHCYIKGDIVVEFLSLDKDLKQEKLMFSIQFNTAFVGSNVLALNREQIDILWDAEELFPSNFRVEVLLSEVDAIVPLKKEQPSLEKSVLPQIHQEAKLSNASGDNLDKLTQQDIQIGKTLHSFSLQHSEIDADTVAKGSEIKGPSASPTVSLAVLHEPTEHILTPTKLQKSSPLELPSSASSSQNVVAFPFPSPSCSSPSASTAVSAWTLPSSISPLQSTPASPKPVLHLEITHQSIPETSSLPSVRPHHSTDLKSETLRSPLPSSLEDSLLTVSTDSAKRNPHTLGDPQISDPSFTKQPSTLSTTSDIPDVLPASCPTSLSVKRATCAEGFPTLSSSPRSGLTQPRIETSASTPPTSHRHPPLQSASCPSPESLSLPPSGPPNRSSMQAIQTGKSFTPPPPPPSFGSLKSAASRKIPLRPFYWTKVARAMKGSLWEEAKKLKDLLRVTEVDTTEVESLFYAPPVTDRQLSTGGRVKKVHLIPFQRARVYEVILKTINIPIPDFMRSLLEFDDSLLGTKVEVDFSKLYPKEEEMKILQGFNGDKENLGTCEQFLLELMKISEVKSKLKSFSFKVQFHTKVADIINDLNIVCSAASEIRNSKKLKIIMLLILSLGNALNQGTSRGSAFGFRLDSLLKLSDTRASKKKMTLMHYLCKVLADKHAEAIDLDKDLINLEPASKIDLKALTGDIDGICKGLNDVEHDMRPSQDDGSETFCKNLEEFLLIAQAELRALTSLHSDMLRNVEALAIYFGEDPARFQYREVMLMLFKFNKMLQRANRENSEQLEMERRKLLAANRKLKGTTLPIEKK